MRRKTKRYHMLGGCVAAAALLSASAVSASDWSITGLLRQTFEAESNRGLDDTTDGAVYGSSTGVSVEIDRESKRALTQIRASLDGVLFAGSSDADGLDRLEPTVAVSHVYRGKKVTISAAGSLRTSSARETQLEDTGVVDENTTQITGSYNLSLEWRASSRTSINFGANGRVIDFSRSVNGLTPTRTYGVSAGATTRVSPTTSINLSTGFRIVDSDNIQNSNSKIVDASVGVTHQRTSRHTVGASSGFSLVFADDNTRSTQTSAGFNGGLSLDYRGKSTRGSLNLSQSVDASNSGEVSAFTRIAGALGYTLNSTQSLNLNAAYTRRSDVDGGGDVRQFFTLGPSFGYQLSDDASLSLGYSLLIDDDENQDIETSHRVLLTLTRRFTLMP